MHINPLIDLLTTSLKIKFDSNAVSYALFGEKKLILYLNPFNI